MLKKTRQFRIFALCALASLCHASWAADNPNSPLQAVNTIDERANVNNLDYVSAHALAEHLNPNRLALRSSTALIFDEREGVTLYARDADKTMAIASLTKLMTAMVTIDAKLPLDEHIKITREDRDRLRGSRSRLAYGTILTRYDMLHISLAASENRSAAALARTYPGGKDAFVAAMNAKAKQLGMKNTRFKDSTGLHSDNVSTAEDLVKLVVASSRYPLIGELTTSKRDSVTDQRSGWEVEFLNTNRLVRSKDWDIEISKTGYIADAGHCLVMKTRIEDRPLVIVLLNSWGKLSKFGDANRIRYWLEKAERRAQRTASAVASSDA